MAMSRAALVTACVAALLVAPCATEALQATTVQRVGILNPYTAADPINDELRQTLRDLGYIEGRTINLEWRHLGGDYSRLAAVATELAQLKPAAIVAIGERTVRAARQAAVTTPIIAGSDDLIGEGHVASLGRPAGNVTGVSILASELNVKRLEVLKAAVPTASRVAVLWDPATGTFHLSPLETLARKLNVALKIEEVRRAEDVTRAFDSARAWRAEAPTFLRHRCSTAFACRSSIAQPVAISLRFISGTSR